MVNGFYSVTYAAGIPVGCGQVRLHDGTISGSDAAFDWSGQYIVEAGRIEGFMVAMPSTSGALNVFLDEQAVELDFSGVVGRPMYRDARHQKRYGWTNISGDSLAYRSLAHKLCRGRTSQL